MRCKNELDDGDISSLQSELKLGSYHAYLYKNYKTNPQQPFYQRENIHSNYPVSLFEVCDIALNITRLSE